MKNQNRWLTVDDKHKNAHLWPYIIQTLESVNKAKNQDGWHVIQRSRIKFHLKLKTIYDTDGKVNLGTCAK